MKVLLVKMSSLGDVIHTLPALSDARAAHPGLAFDWVVEEAFREVPAWHPAVARVIPIALRRWRRAPLAACRSGEWASLRRALSAARYDLVLDAQGLLKSAFVTRLVPGPRAGYDRRSVREAPAALAYERRIAVPRALHAIERSRRLFAAALGYEVPDGGPDYGLDAGRLTAAAEAPARDAVLFLHGSSRPDKCWPEAHWIALGARAAQAGLRVLLPWGSAAERERAGRIAQALPHARVLPRLALADLASLMRTARAVVAVDTGLGHLAAALGRPCVSLYGPTRTALIGATGPGQRHVCAPGGAMDAIAPESVWPALAAALEPS